ncbi:MULTISPECIES: hypothetical protein [unclassified Mesorhizobium]|uniref:hypothetical protein n=1 Tax=unclassified Mesorhizobium TaxID=325217 RepID=UPI001140D8FC|nr:MULTISPECIES: hypothetical protein [unclassified Mesorhizobium]
MSHTACSQVSTNSTKTDRFSRSPINGCSLAAAPEGRSLALTRPGFFTTLEKLLLPRLAYLRVACAAVRISEADLEARCALTAAFLEGGKPLEARYAGDG